MCGFVGFLGHSFGEDDLHKANAIIHHRGPDADGVYFDARNGVGLAHKRLSIIELSMLGSQPMVSRCGRFVIVFNGEIYNHQEIRQQTQSLFAHSWRGNSDTETLLELIAAEGLNSALEKLVGMFAFALWDKSKRTITLARDRMGEKPLYYGWLNGGFVFASEPKALFALSGQKAALDLDAVKLYFHHGYVPAPLTIWENIKKLRPGRSVTMSLSAQLSWPEEITYWDLVNVTIQDDEAKFQGDEESALDALAALLEQSISLQSCSDVKLGTFLSGGIDSSLITALLQKNSTEPIETFSIGFSEAEFNEAHYAREVAAYLRTNHNELIVDSHEVQKLLPQIINMFDEPFADDSAFPTFLVSKLASEKVTVCLSGDAGDELFCGYNRYFNHWSYDLWQRLRSNHSFRILIQSLTTSTRLLHGNIGAKLWRLRGLTDCTSHDDYFRWLGGNSGPIVKSGFMRLESYNMSDNFYNKLPDNESRFMAFDCAVFLPDDILFKVDRSSMASSLETRAPFLDHRIVEFAWSLPLDMKAQNGVGKTILRKLLYRYVPEDLVNRPKQGFSMPVKHWLRGDLKEWAADMITSKSLRSFSFVNFEILESRWREHQAGGYDWSESIWKAALFADWLENNKV